MKFSPISLAKKSTALRILMRDTRNLVRKLRYILVGVTINADDKIVIFGSYNGKSYACSPKAVYEYMLNEPAFNDYRFVWFFDEPEKYSFLAHNRNTVVVKNRSKECEKYLHKAKYWIFNFRALDYWIPKGNQVYIQCWHGTPLKKLGYDILTSTNAMNSVIEIRGKYRNDAKRLSYLLSPCDFVTEKFITAWNLGRFNKENAVLEIGYPRNDYLVNYKQEDIERIKESLGLNGCNKKVILYAPTWRDNQHDARQGYTYDNPVDFDYLKEKLGDDYIIIFRAHYLVANQFDFEAYKGFVYNASDYDDINELYVISDLLITDYSSVFFDYALLQRPMLFYMYDMEEYRDEMRGFYFSTEHLPGPVVKTEKELVASIDYVMNSKDYTCDYTDFNNEYNTLNDGKATERLVKKIFGNR